MKKLFFILSLIFITSCGKQVELNYEKLEAQYIELTTYWEQVIESGINTPEAARFSVLYKDAQKLIEEYKDPSRGVSAGGLWIWRIEQIQ